MKSRRSPLNAENKALLLRQFEAFRMKFGRDPVKGDPLFFDPTSDTPEPLLDPVQAQAHAELVVALEEIDAPPAIIYAVRKTQQLVTEANEKELTPEQQKEWDSAISEYETRIKDESYAIALCFSLPDSSSGSLNSVDESFVATRLSLMIREAYSRGISSHPLEGTFLNAWLSLLCMKFNISQSSTEAFRTCLGTDMSEIQSILDEMADEFESSINTDALRKKTARIEEARELPASWFGEPPETRPAASTQIPSAFELVQRTLAECREASIPVDAVERMLFRYWLRTWVVNEDFPEAYFQSLDLHLSEVLSRVDRYMKKYAGPLRAIQ